MSTTTENPVDYLIRRSGMTRIAFTKEFGFGENHLLLVAQGRKSSVGPKLVDALLVTCRERGIQMSRELEQAYGTPLLEEAWEEWRELQRGKAQLPATLRSGTGSPWERLVRHFGSISQTAKALRVRDVHVRKYMDVPDMPKPIRDALQQTSWVNRIDQFEVAQRRYFKDKGRKR